jgi:hypothetical protein
MANDDESSVNETIAKALWLFFIPTISRVAAGESNPPQGDDRAGALPAGPDRKPKTY